MKYRSLLLHSCRCIVFGCLDSNLVLNSNCLFVLKGNRIRKKREDNLPKPLLLQPSSAAAAHFPLQSRALSPVAKSARAPQFFPAALLLPSLRPSQPSPVSGPLRPMLTPRPPAVSDGWGPPIIPHLRPFPTRARPRVRPPCAWWPRAPSPGNPPAWPI
jgi:hypothetical protein